MPVKTLDVAAEIAPTTFPTTFTVVATVESFVSNDLVQSYQIGNFVSDELLQFYNINRFVSNNSTFTYEILFSSPRMQFRLYVYPSRERFILRGFSLRAVTRGVYAYYSYRDSYGLVSISYGPTEEFPKFALLLEEFEVIEL